MGRLSTVGRVSGLSRTSHAKLADRRSHDAVLCTMARPAWLQKGDELESDKWHIVLEDPNKLRDATVTINFRVPVAPGPVYLTDAGREDDLLTAKLYVIHALSNLREGWIDSGKSLVRSFNSFLVFLRWRLAIGLDRCANLTGDFYDLFRDTLELGGPRALSGSEDKAQTYIAELREKGWLLPVYMTGGARTLAMRTILTRLGFTHTMQMSSAAVLTIIGYLRETDPIAFANYEAARRAPKRPLREDTDRIAGTYLRLLRVWKSLWDLRHRLQHDPIGYRAFTSQRALNQEAATLATRSWDKTPDAPPFQTCALVSTALEWVLEYGPVLRRLHSDLAKLGEMERAKPMDKRTLRKRLQQLLPSCPPRHSNIDAIEIIPAFGTPRTLPPHAISLRTLLFVLMPAACAIVIATFTARRRMEIESLRTDCVERDAQGQPWLWTWIEKSLRDLDRIPIPEGVVQAVDTLIWLGDAARTEASSPWLFEFRDLLGSQRPVQFNLEKALDAFVEFIKLPPLEDGTPVRFRPHMFRRFFGVTYYYRFDAPNLTALSVFYMHFNADATRHYLTMNARGATLRLIEQRDSSRAVREEARKMTVAARERLSHFEAAGRGFIRDRCLSVAKGTMSMTGRGAKALTKVFQDMVAQADARVALAVSKTAGEKDFNDILDTLLSGRTMEPNAQGHAFCTCGRDAVDLLAAKCLQESEKWQVAGGRQETAATDGSGPDVAFASIHNCGACVHGITFPCNKPAWSSAIAAEHQLADHGPSERARERATNRLTLLEEEFKLRFPERSGERDG
ncbi:site-specific integrase [Aquibium carbonis]|uniref:Site-specific integrase n=1 Tax=Aquibium carbonis TaxID=2495581 RepID=A0A3S0A996_9HYPH|nr:site-specific integrase [Aquibium carbonis]RST87604.1 site-specific integrase [Aquibium carbonis]